MRIYLCQKRCCPNVEIQGDTVIVDDDNGGKARLNKTYWNQMVQLIRDGELGEI